MTNNHDKTVTTPAKPTKTLAEELVERIAAELQEAQAANRFQEEQDEALRAAEQAEKLRAELAIAKVREAILAPTRSIFKRVMILEPVEVHTPPREHAGFDPYRHLGWSGYKWQVSESATAAQQVMKYCDDNNIRFRIVASYLETYLVDKCGHIRRDAEPDSFSLQVAYLRW